MPITVSEIAARVREPVIIDYNFESKFPVDNHLSMTQVHASTVSMTGKCR